MDVGRRRLLTINLSKKTLKRYEFSDEHHPRSTKEIRRAHKTLLVTIRSNGDEDIEEDDDDQSTADQEDGEDEN